VQYASASGSTWQVTALTGTLAPGKYYLIKQGGGSGGNQDLPTSDVTGTINLAASSGKVALVNSKAALSGACPPGSSYVDFVGYGSTTCFEGTAGSAPAPGNTKSVLRKENGCQDGDDNAGDFVVNDFGGQSPTPPRDSGTPANICGHSQTASSGLDALRLVLRLWLKIPPSADDACQGA
jgi:hypothetical protein